MDEADIVWDCIVIGGGVIGLSTAHTLAKRGVKTLTLEQFYLPHTRGSSHGQSRLIRKCHDSDFYTKLTGESYTMWQQIQEEAKKQLMLVTGLILLQKDKGGQDVETATRLMVRHNIEHECLTGQDINNRYPMVRYSTDYKGVLDKTAAILFADTCLQVLQKLINRNGGVIKDGIQVLNIQPGDNVTIETNQGKFVSKKVVIATGPWSKEILGNLNINIPLKNMPGLHVFWRSSKITDFMPNKLPMLYDLVGSYNGVPYESGFVGLFPCFEYHGIVKVVSRGEPPPFYCHPDKRDSQSMQPMVDVIAKYISEHYPGIETKPSIIEPCMYCMTPDKCAVIDKHPIHSNIIIGTGFSGRGFTLAPVAGEMLSDLVMEGKTKWNMSKFSLRRFEIQQSKL